MRRNPPYRSRSPWTFFLAPGLALACTACGSLDVSTGTDKGLPFYLAEHEFRVTEMGFDKDGKLVTDGNKPLVVSLVTRADTSRAFSIRNNAAWLANSGFSLTRDANGRMTAVSGSSTGQLGEVVEALVSVVATVGSARDGDPAEVDVQEALKEGYVERLDALETALEEEQGKARSVRDQAKIRGFLTDIEQTQEALAQAEARIVAIKAATAAKNAAKLKTGVRASANKPVTVEHVATEAIAQTKADALNDGDLAVYLIPVQ